MTILLLVALIALPALGCYLGIRWERRRMAKELESVVTEATKEFLKSLGSDHDVLRRIAESLEADEDDERTQVLH